jgi:hypothetical protein
VKLEQDKLLLDERPTLTISGRCQATLCSLFISATVSRADYIFLAAINLVISLFEFIRGMRLNLQRFWPTEDFKPAPNEKLVLSRARDPALVLPLHGGTSSSQRLSRQRGSASFDNAARGGGEESRRTEVRKQYYCHWCSTRLVLSATEFLKHKQLHQRDGD